jgi:hypothetical protein
MKLLTTRRTTTIIIITIIIMKIYISTHESLDNFSNYLPSLFESHASDWNYPGTDYKDVRGGVFSRHDGS